MKNFLLIPLFLIVLSFSISAQVSDTVQLGGGYVNQAFYQLSTQSKTHAAFNGSNGWDIGFQTTLMNASIISDENSILVYKVTDADSSSYATLDVSGYSSWPQQYNSDATWDLGAFNSGEDLAAFRFGWGTYDFNTHEVYGDSLFVLVKGSDIYKFWIRKKTATGDYIIRYANVTSGGNDVNITIPAETYASKNFVYLNLDNPSSIMDIEPASASWDILFTHYYTEIPYAGYYPVTGVYSNTGVTVAKAYPVDITTVSVNDYLGALSDNLTAIGYDWKIFDMYQLQYFIEDSLIYFVKDKNSVIYSLRFTDFPGDGTISFETEHLLTGIGNAGNEITQAAIYPNPVSTHATIVYDAKKSVMVDAQLFDISGREIVSIPFEAQPGLNYQSLSLPRLSQGLYHLVLNAGEEKINLKLVVAH